MRATVMFGAHDVRVENVPDARRIEPTDALGSCCYLVLGSKLFTVVQT